MQYKEKITHDFQNKFSFESRIEESKQIMNEHKGRIPIIIESKNLTIKLDKKKFLVPDDINIGQLLFIIRKRISLSHNEAIFLITDNGFSLTATTLISKIYNDYKHEDGFLYFFCEKEAVFG